MLINLDGTTPLDRWNDGDDRYPEKSPLTDGSVCLNCHKPIQRMWGSQGWTNWYHVNRHYGTKRKIRCDIDSKTAYYAQPNIEWDI